MSWWMIWAVIGVLVFVVLWSCFMACALLPGEGAQREEIERRGRGR